jgi:hypothetical protein
MKRESQLVELKKKRRIPNHRDKIEEAHPQELNQL